MNLDERRLERLLDVGRSLVEDLDLELVLRRVLDAARELTGARYAALGILDDQREELKQFLTVGLDEPDPECDLDYTPNVGKNRKVNFAMSNSFAFGGLNAVLVFGPAPA